MSLGTEIGCFPSPGAIVISCSSSQLDGTSEIIVASTDGALNLDRGSSYISSLVIANGSHLILTFHYDNLMATLWQLGYYCN